MLFKLVFVILYIWFVWTNDLGKMLMKVHIKIFYLIEYSFFFLSHPYSRILFWYVSLPSTYMMSLFLNLIQESRVYTRLRYINWWNQQVLTGKLLGMRLVQKFVKGDLDSLQHVQQCPQSHCYQGGLNFLKLYQCSLEVWHPHRSLPGC